jgi:protein-tyrosine phosphatase
VKPGPITGSYWIEPDRLLAGPYPGARADALVGIDVVVALTEEGELPPYALPAGVRLVRRAIRDFGCPEPADVGETLDLLDRELEAGKRVYLHCRGGVGRTGTVLACYLVRKGLSPEDALAQLRSIGKGPETGDQRRLVEGWAGA